MSKYDSETNRDTPPPPRFIHDLLPAGLLGYEQRKAVELLQAKRDRESRVHIPDERELLITRLAQAFPYIDVAWIAAQVDPWDSQRFKELVADRQAEYLRECQTN